MKQNQILAVVPAYNEEHSVARVVKQLKEKTPEIDVLVVDDGSTDQTSQKAAAAGARVARLPYNLGIGGAVQTGFVYAHEHNYQGMVQVDGDGQHDPREIHRLIQTINAEPVIDMVCGSRFITKESSYLAPIGRRTGIHIFAFLLSRIVRQPVSDPTSGFRLYNRKAISLFARDYPHDYPEVEAILMLHSHRLKMKEIPVQMFHRDGGVSSISSGKSLYYMVKVLLALLIGLFRAKSIIDPGDSAPVSASHNL